MSLPPVSVIIPAHNRGRMLGQALRSLERQTFSDFAVILCDDASTEDLRKVANEFPRLAIAFHRFDQSGGAAVNHQRGIDLCRTRYAIFLHSDDLLLPTALESMLGLMESHPDAALCRGGSVEFRETDGAGVEIVKEQMPTPVPWPLRRWLPIRNYDCVAPSQTMLRMEAVRAVGGYNLGFRIIYDWELVVALSSAAPGLTLGETVLGYRLHDAQSINQGRVEAGAVVARDTLFMTSAANPMRARLKMPRLQQLYLRHWVGWGLIRQGLRSRTPLANLLRVCRLLAEFHALVLFVACAPLWFLIFLATRPARRPEAEPDPERRAGHQSFLDEILCPPAADPTLSPVTSLPS